MVNRTRLLNPMVRLALSLLLVWGLGGRGTAQAQSADVDALLQQYPQINWMAGYVLNWETNMNRRMWRQVDRSVYGDLSPDMDQAPVILEDRQGQPVDLETFRREVWQGHPAVNGI